MAESEEQARAVRVALAAKRGNIERAKLKGATLDMFKNMTEEELKELLSDNNSF